MKIGIIGHGSGLGKALRLLLETKYNDIEVIEATQEQVDEGERKLAIVGGMQVCHFESKDFKAEAMCPTWSLSGSSKSGSNKSDRKRNRKDRWR